MRKKFNKGDVLYAIDPCVMEDTGKSSLTVGKAYVVTSCDDDRFWIIDDQEDTHSFTLKNYQEFFQIDKFLSLSDYDARGVRAYAKHNDVTGAWAAECFRKKRPDENEGEHDWRWVREETSSPYYSREEAETAALNIAKRVCEENNF